MRPRLLVITPVRNEAVQIVRVAEAMRRQTHPPETWIVIDDGSTDGTLEALEGLAEPIEFMQLCRATPLPTQGISDHLAVAAEARAFNQALGRVRAGDFTHVAKLDGDIELPPEYFEQLLDEFEQDAQLGLAGGVLREPTRDGWAILFGQSEHHVRGAVKCYTSDCFARIGGIEERLGWDTIDEIRARMCGFRTRAFGHIVATHHRPLGSAEGILRGRARHGRCDYITHYPFWWVTARAIKTAAERPWGISGVAFLGGYLRAAAVRERRVGDPAFRVWIRHELVARVAAVAGLEQVASRVAPRSRQCRDEAQPTVASLSSQTFADHV